MIVSANPAMAGTYDYGEVVRSVFIAILASYAALDLAGRVTAAKGWVRSAWLIGGASAMGVGLWCMLFKGMLAFHLPIPVSYHWPTVLLSLLAAVMASAVALYVVSREKMGRVQALTGSVIMGAGIAGMHYIGMAAMRLSATSYYNPLLVTASVVIAVLASLAALILTFHFREDFKGTTPAKLLSSAAMGAAISLMLYTAMASVSFLPSAVLPNMSHAGSISSLGNSGIALVTAIVLAAAMLTSSMDRRADVELRRLNEEMEHRVVERTSQLSAANEELKKLRDELRLVVDTIPTMAWSVQPDGAVDFLNQRWLDYSGLTLEQEVEDPTRVIHPEDLPRVMEKWLVDMAAGEPSEDEMRLQRADGEYRWFLVRTAPLRDQRGNIVKWYGVSIDIEDRKRSAEAVRRSEAYLAAAQRLTHVGSWSLDLSTGELHWSAETFRIFSFEPAASADLQEMFLSRIHPGDRPMIEQGLENALTVTEPFEVEYRIVWPDGSVKAIRESVFPRLGKSGEVVERYGVVADITERKQAENDLRRLSGRLLQLQDEERRKIARDLHDSTGQDLVALATMLGQLRTSLPSSQRKSRKLLSECKALAERCIREVRTLSYVLHPPALDQAGLAGAIRDYVRGFTERSGIHVGLELSPDVGRMARDVELTLFRVVQESLANIQRHSGSRHAKIRIAQIPMDRRADLVLEISDTGHGASGSLPKDASRSPFQFGVGIQSMQERVNLIGGRLEIESTNSGTIVRVTVPPGGSREKSSHFAG